jgi:hypothetical protein
MAKPRVLSRAVYAGLVVSFLFTLTSELPFIFIGDFWIYTWVNINWPVAEFVPDFFKAWNLVIHGLVTTLSALLWGSVSSCGYFVYCKMLCRGPGAT